MKRKHTEAYRKRHSSPQHSKQYDRQFARIQMKRFIEQQKQLSKGGGMQ
jgi:hypothetical protein